MKSTSKISSDVPVTRMGGKTSCTASSGHLLQAPQWARQSVTGDKGLGSSQCSCNTSHTWPIEVTEMLMLRGLSMEAFNTPGHGGIF